MVCNYIGNSVIMKATIQTKNPHRRHAAETGKGIVLLVLFTLITVYSFSQTAPYLDFKNPILESGVAGADGAQYRFSNVTNNVDAIVTITRRSDVLVNILNPDMNTSGFDGAFQPQVGYNNGSTPGVADWWMEFQIQFVATGTINAVVIPEFNVSGVDIDGNSQYINEYVGFFDMQDYIIETGSGLSVTNLYENINGSVLSGRRFDGPVANYTNIDTSATSVMVTNHYINKNSIVVRTGGRSSAASGAADRMYSFYFQNFTYNTPYNSLLALNRDRVRPSKKNENDVMKVYPNPSTGNINIIVPDEWTANNFSVRVLDVKGNVVNRSGDNLVSSTKQVDLSNLKAGVYMLHMVSGNQSAIQRVVKM